MGLEADYAALTGAIEQVMFSTGKEARRGRLQGAAAAIHWTHRMQPSESP